MTEHAQGNVDARVAAIAARQHGVFTRGQARACGATTAMVRWRADRGRWEQIYPGVYRLAGSTITWHQLAAATCLWHGERAVLSGMTAAFLHGCPVPRPRTVEVIVPRARHRCRHPRVVVRSTSRSIPRRDVMELQGLRITGPARTLLDLAATAAAETVEQCLDDLLRRKRVSLEALDRRLAEMAPQRTRGLPVLRELVGARRGCRVTESQLETDLGRALSAAGLPVPQVQYVIRAQGRFVARVDLAYPDARVAIEVDGFRFHDGRRRFDHDRERANEIVALGWQVLRVTSTHLEQDPGKVVRWVARALGAE